MALIKLNNRSSEDTAIHGRRNLIINGAMQVAQRGTSVTGKTDLSYHTVDRWQSVSSGSTYNQSQQAVTLGDSTIGDFKYFLRHEVTTSNDFAGILYKIEDVQSVPEGVVTLSFYAKGTNPGGGSLQLRGRQNFGSGGSPSSEVIENAQSLVLTSSWQRFTYQITVPSILGKNLGTTANTSYYRIDFQQPGVDDTTDAWTLDITGVQLEVGDTATPFEHRSYGEELSLCQRYYYNHITAGSGQEALVTTATSYNTTSAYCGVRFPVTMRTIPTIRQYDATDVWQYYNNNQSDRFDSFSMFGANQSTINQAMINNGQGMSITAGQSGNFQGGNSACYLHFDAEL